MSPLEKEFHTLRDALVILLNQASHDQDLENIRLEFLSRKGKLADLMSQLKNLTSDEKRILGPLANTIKTEIETLFLHRKEALFKEKLQREEEVHRYFDVTAYASGHRKGSLHPLTHLTEKNVAIFRSLGFSVADGPEVETEFYNFEALNIPQDHPARDMQDTFWLDVPGMLLRTQTSNVQIRTMQTKKPPIAIIVPGRVYRQEATDASHDFMFNQLEGLVVDTQVSLADLLNTLKNWLRLLFNKDDITLRVRPGYFPFVEPGIEVDIACPFCTQGCSTCKKTGWIEMGGAGLVHPHVLKAGGVDPEQHRGFAFGFGTTRLAMLLYGINDIRLLHCGKKEFLKQF